MFKKTALFWKGGFPYACLIHNSNIKFLSVLWWKCAPTKKTESTQTVHHKVWIWSDKVANRQTGRRRPMAGKGFSPFWVCMNTVLAPHKHLLLSSLFNCRSSWTWWPRCRKEKKFHFLSLQCRHTGRKLPKTSLQSRFLFACWPPPSCRSQHGLCAQGSTVIFHCEAGGVPAPDLSWNVKSGERQWCCCKKVKRGWQVYFISPNGSITGN